MSGEPDPYKVLGVEPDAEHKTIAAAHRVLARRHHPDVSRDPAAEARMAEINAAWTLLRDPARRNAYDLEHGVRTRRRDGRAENPIARMQAVSRATPSAPSEPDLGSAPQPVGRPGQIAWRRGPHGEGAAGPPPGRPVGSVLPFGRHIGWSLGEIARVDPGYLQWLAGKPDGRPYAAEIEKLLAPMLRTADRRDPVNPTEGEGTRRDPTRRR